MSRTILPIFSSRTFIISDLTFSSLVWVYFLHGIKTYSNLILLHVVCNYNFSNYIIHLCLLILYLFCVLGNCINCVNCFLHFSILFSVFRTSLLSLSWIIFQIDWLFPLCLFGLVSFYLFLSFVVYFSVFSFFLTCSTWSLLFLGFRVVLLLFDFCPWRERLFEWFVLTSC